MEPKRSSAEKKLLAAVRSQLKRSRQDLRSASSIHFQMDRLQRVSDRAHRRVVDGVLRRSGVDFEALHRRQKPLVARLEKLSREAWRDARASARSVSLRHKEWILDHGRRIATFQGDFPGIVNCLDSAVVEASTVATSAPMPAYSLDVGTPGHNAANILMNTGGHHDDGRLEEQTTFIDFHFTWLCPRDGVADASSFVFPNGAYWVRALDSSCDAGGWAKASLDCWMSLAQPGAVPTTGPKSTHRLDVIANKGRWDDSTGESRIAGFSDMSSLEAWGAYVRAGEPIVVTVTVGVSCSAGGVGRSTLDFDSGPWEINVPGV